MELKNGYHNTEIGPIPTGWRCESLMKKIEITHGYGFKSQYFTTNGPHKLTTPGHFYEDGGFRDIGEKQKFYDGPVPNGYVLNQNDVIVAMTEQADGLLGSAAIVPESNVFLHNQRLGKLVLKSNDFDLHFLYRIFNSSKYRSKVRETAAGTKVKHTSPNKLLEIVVPIPPPEEQRAIADALSDVDALINALDVLITNKSHIKQGTMQQLLNGKKRLPGFRGKWKDCELKDCLLANPDYGINAPGVPHTSNLPTYLRITDIDDDGRFMPDDCVAVNHPQAMDYILRENEIVFARTGASVGKTYLYNPDDDELVFAGFLIRAKIDPKKLCPEFFSAFTKTGLYWNWVRVMSMRSGQPGINGNEYATLELELPPTVEEQETIARILVDMDSEIAALEQKRDKTKLIKQGMMQELLTGKTRLV